MKKETKATALRQKAEAMLKTRTVAARCVSEPDTLKLIHELEVHQIELELLNEELQLGKQQAELAAEKYTSLYDFAPTGYFSLSAGGKILELNLACSRMLGRERLHLQNKLFGFFVSNESKPAFNHFLAEAFSGTANVTCEIKLAANGGIPMVVSLTGVSDESGEQCMVTAVDITERKLAEARLQKDTERNALLMELFVQATALTDKELYDRALDIAVKLTDSKIGFFHQVSDNQQEIILTTWNDEARKNCTTITDNHYPIKAAGNWADCVRQKQAVVYNDFQQSPNQKGLPEGHAPVGRFMSIPVVQDDKVQLIFGVGNKTTDYTDSDVVQIQLVAGELHKILEKRKVEQSLHKIEDRWQFAIEGSNDGIWDWNVLTDEVYFSNRWKEMIGYGPDELEGKLSDWKERVHADDLPEVMETLQRHFNGESPQYITEHRIRCRDGSWKWITDRGKVLEWTPEGKPARMVGTHIDITGRKLVEDTQKFLLGCGLPGMGEDFFESLARYLAETLNMEYVCIDQLEGDRLTAQTVAIYNEGRFESNVRYTLRDTPCGEVAEKHVCCYPEGVQRKFPNDAALQELNAESYVGTTLIDSNGQAIGLIAIIGHHPLAEAGKAESLLKLVAPRAAGEMERLKIETERSQAESKLKESEEKFRIVADNAFNWEFWEGEDGQWIHHSPSCKKLTGYSADEFMNDNELLLKIIHPDDLQAYLIHHQEAKTYRAPASHYFRIITKEGETRDIEHVCQPVFNNTGSTIGIRGSNIDITERKRAEEKLRASEAMMSASQRLGHIGSWVLDMSSNRLTWSDEVYRIFGIEPQAFGATYEAFLDRIHPDDRQAVDAVYTASLRERRDDYEIEHRIVRLDTGAVRHVHERGHNEYDAAGAVLRSVGMVQDITEQKKLEASLRESEEKFREMADLLPQVVFETDNNYCFTYLNKTAFEIFGYPYDYPILGVNLLNFCTPESRVSAMHNILQIISENQTGGANEYVMVKHDGTTIPVLVFSNPIVKDGKNIGLRGILVNISELKQMEQELVKAKEHAEESDRLKSAFLANMSHEIRTPMNGILGFAGLLKEPNLSGEEQQEFIGIIEKSGARMLNIINDIVDISKIEAGLMKLDIRETNINEQIEYIYTFFKPEVEAKGMKLSFKTPFPASEAIISTDREKLYAIFTNLVKNAIKYSGYGEIDMGYKIKGEFLEFFVKDTGIGIPKDRQQAIFERFIQADISDNMAKQGAGLGLSITKAYIEMLGGKIWVESEEGIGSTFYFTLPYNSGAAQVFVDQSLVNSLKGAVVRKLKILIAEDDETSEILLEKTVSNFSKELLIARTGIEAVDICKQNPDIDLVLMDIKMPEMSGYEAISHIREFNKEVIIIAQTAYGLSGDREKALEAGCNDYISKPIVKAKLETLIKKYFGK